MRAWNRPLIAPLNRIAEVANALGGELRARIVFIGGAVLPLLQEEDDLLGSARPTKDVDGVIATTSYSQKARIEDALRERRFRNQMNASHMDRWQTPDGTIFDLVACGAHPGGSGSEHDMFAIETADAIDLPPVIRHASAVGYLTLKFGAFRDRGKTRPLESKDLADIVALVATRPRIVDEAHAAPEAIREFLRTQALALLADKRALSSITTHLRDNDPLVDDLEMRVLDRLRAL